MWRLAYSVGLLEGEESSKKNVRYCFSHLPALRCCIDLVFSAHKIKTFEGYSPRLVAANEFPRSVFPSRAMDFCPPLLPAKKRW
jgi:hypothetical protein